MPESLAYEVHRSQHFLRKLQHLGRYNMRTMLRDGVAWDTHEMWEALEELEGHLSRMANIARAIGAPMAGEPTPHIDGGMYCTYECMEDKRDHNTDAAAEDAARDEADDV